METLSPRLLFRENMEPIRTLTYEITIAERTYQKNRDKELAEWIEGAIPRFLKDRLDDFHEARMTCTLIRNSKTVDN